MIRTLYGTVVSDKMDKTVVVAVQSLKEHPIYRKKYKVTSKFKAHDEANEARVGDTVLIEESRPLSATKRWRLVSIIARAGDAATAAPVVEEAETDEAIHGAAHPGKHAGSAEAAR